MLLKAMTASSPSAWRLCGQAWRHRVGPCVGRRCEPDLCRWAIVHGATVIGMTSIASEIDHAKRAGCARVIRYAQGDFGDAIMRLIDGRGADAYMTRQLNEGVVGVTLDLECLLKRALPEFNWDAIAHDFGMTISISSLASAPDLKFSIHIGIAR